ncbi:hypothetical protein ACWDUN_22795 [Mycobacterium sp. NPDC003323]
MGDGPDYHFEVCVVAEGGDHAVKDIAYVVVVRCLVAEFAAVGDAAVVAGHSGRPA